MAKLKYTLSLVNTGTQLHESFAWGKGRGRQVGERRCGGEFYTDLVSEAGGREGQEGIEGTVSSGIQGGQSRASGRPQLSALIPK